MSLTLRPALPSDRQAIANLLTFAGNFNEDEVQVGLELIDSFHAPAATGGLEGDYPTLVAEMDRVLVGYATIGPTPFTVGTWHLYFIASDIQRRRAGIGRALCSAIKDFAKARGGHRLVLETSGRELYGGTRQFYHSTGFVEEGRIADYYAEGDPVVYFVWRW